MGLNFLIEYVFELTKKVQKCSSPGILYWQHVWEDEMTSNNIQCDIVTYGLYNCVNMVTMTMVFAVHEAKLVNGIKR